MSPACDILLKGGRVIDPKNDFDAAADLAVKDGKIAKIEKLQSADSVNSILDILHENGLIA